MKKERRFETVTFEGLKCIRYRCATHDGVSADVYLTSDAFCRNWEVYATQIPRFRSDWPTRQEFADESLHYILYRAWPDGMPADIKDLMSKTKVCAFEGHGNQYPRLGWGAHFHDGKRIPVRRLLNHLYSSGYETVMFAICNPGRHHLEPEKGSVIYPVGAFGINPKDFEMLVKRSSRN